MTRAKEESLVWDALIICIKVAFYTEDIQVELCGVVALLGKEFQSILIHFEIAELFRSHSL